MQAVPKSRYLVFLLIALGGALLDLWSKSWIFDHLGMPGRSEPIWLIDEVFGLETHLNEGALFGIGFGWGLGFVVLSFLALLGIGYWLVRGGAAREWILVICLGAIVGGILGNVYDRLGLPGLSWHRDVYLGQERIHQAGDAVYAVRDWLHVKYDPWNFDWPIFNLADSLLVCGVGLLIFHAYVLEPRGRKAPKAVDSEESGSAGKRKHNAATPRSRTAAVAQRAPAK